MNPYQYKVVGIILLCLILSAKILLGQDIENTIQNLHKRVEDKEWLKMTGGISASANFNAISGIDRRFDPFTWRLTANVNLNFLGVNAPFFASFSDGNTLYNLPSYSFYGISPTYKWVTLHLGDRSMNFSPYTFSGHNFFGSGLEIKPGKFHFSTFYGRLKRAVAEDLNSRQSLDPTYRRMGWGIKTGYNDGNNSLSLILFKAKDDASSIPLPEVSSQIRPQENLVLGLTGKKQLSKLFSLAVDYARSALTQDQDSPADGLSPSDLSATMGGLFQPNLSSAYFNAIKSSLSVKTKIGQFNLNHEWIDPGYRTLGALFFNNDMENITASTATSFFENKWTIASNLGIQRSNLKGDATQSARRFIGSVNTSLSINKQLNLSFNYSNFSTTNRLRAVSIPFIQVDSILLAQTNQSANVSMIYTKGETQKSTWMAQLSYQKANTIENDVVQTGQSTTYYLGNLSYTWSAPSSKLNLNGSLLINYGSIPNIDLLTISPNLTVSQSLLDKKLRVSSSMVFSMVQTNQQPTNLILSLRNSTIYQFLKNHQLAMNLSWLNNQSNSFDNRTTTFNELMGSLQYQFNF